MKLKIFTTVTNQPAFAELQAQTFKQFLDCDYEFHIIDDSFDHLNLTDKYGEICKNNSVFYHRKPDRITPHQPMIGCAYAVQWTYDNLIKKFQSQSFCCPSGYGPCLLATFGWPSLIFKMLLPSLFFRHPDSE